MTSYFNVKYIIAYLTVLFFVFSCSTETPDFESEETTFNTSGIVVSDSETTSSTTEMIETTDENKLDLPQTKEDVGTCADVEINIQQTIPTIVILIDRSGSMTQDFGGISRWSALYNSLMDPVNGVIYLLQSSIRFGLVLYDGTADVCPNLITVMYDLDNFQSIDDVYSMYIPNMDTPTGESLAQVANSLSLIQTTEPKAIVLATDGEPDFCGDPNGDGRPMTIQAAQDAYNNGINTYVISVGTAIAVDHLQEVANAGVGRPVDSPNPAPYYQTTDQQQLVDAFNQIIGNFVSCEFSINGVVNPEKICDGSVFIDGQILECGSEWTVEDNILKIFGASCDILQDGTEHEINAKFPCDAVYIP